MGLRKIIAHLECDSCGVSFTSIVPNDASAQPTVFEGVRESLDQCQREGSRVYEEGGYHDGEFYGPCCWEKKSEEIFVQEIKDGKVTEKQLVEWDMFEEYGRHVPRPLLEDKHV